MNTPHDIDNSAQARIFGIAKGTGSPFGTILRAMKELNRGNPTDKWALLFSCLSDLYHARDDDDAREAIDGAHEALQGMREYDYDGTSIGIDDREEDR